jgi:hypothetical protein
MNCAERGPVCCSLTVSRRTSRRVAATDSQPQPACIHGCHSVQMHCTVSPESAGGSRKLASILKKSLKISAYSSAFIGIEFRQLLIYKNLAAWLIAAVYADMLHLEAASILLHPVYSGEQEMSKSPDFLNANKRAICYVQSDSCNRVLFVSQLRVRASHNMADYGNFISAYIYTRTASNRTQYVCNECEHLSHHLDNDDNEDFLPECTARSRPMTDI